MYNVTGIFVQGHNMKGMYASDSFDIIDCIEFIHSVSLSICVITTGICYFPNNAVYI